MARDAGEDRPTLPRQQSEPSWKEVIGGFGNFYLYVHSFGSAGLSRDFERLLGPFLALYSSCISVVAHLSCLYPLVRSLRHGDHQGLRVRDFHRALSTYEGAAEWIEAVSKSSGLSLSTEVGILTATIAAAILKALILMV